MYQINVLLVEDDSRIREIISKYIRSENYLLFEAETGEQAQELLEARDYHIAILDVMLPDTDGWTLLRQIKEQGTTPVIMLTARSEEEDKLFGFDLGADDYMTKPFSAKELIARIKVLLKRHEITSANDIIQIHAIEVNTTYHQVSVAEKIVELTPLEYSLLMYFIDHKNIALSRNQILDGVWGYDYYGDDRTVDTHVKRLRQKLGGQGEYIKTIRGLGYRLVVQ